MSNNLKTRFSRDRQEYHRENYEENGTQRGKRSIANDDNVDREDRAVPEEKVLDPVEEARKALEIFQEVSGEVIVHIIPNGDKTMKAESEERYDEHRYLGSQGDFRELPVTHKDTSGHISKSFGPKRKLEGDSEFKAENKQRKEENAGERGKDDEEKARQKKRIEDGEARRREFRPKIARLQDTNCLL